MIKHEERQSHLNISAVTIAAAFEWLIQLAFAAVSRCSVTKSSIDLRGL